MDLSASNSNSSTSIKIPSSTQLDNVETSNSTEAINNDDTTGSNILYKTAAENSSSTSVSFSDGANNNSPLNSTENSSKDDDDLLNFDLSETSVRSDLDTTTFESKMEEDGHPGATSTATLREDVTDHCVKNERHNSLTEVLFDMSIINASFPESDSKEVNASQEEDDPKSQLANKTILKRKNLNLSSIKETNENSIKVQDIKNNAFAVETSEDDTKNAAQKKGHAKDPLLPNVGRAIKNVLPNKLPTENLVEKIRRKTESFIDSSKQRLNIAISKPFAAESASPSAVVNDSPIIGNGLLPGTKREIKIFDSLEEFEKNLPSTVTVLDTPFGSKVYLVGTAHFSEESQDDVSFVIRNVRPDIVMVELCPSRIPILKLDEKTLLEEAKNFNITKIRNIIQSHGCINGIFFILLLQMSAQIAKDLGMAPGGEFRRAFEEIHKIPGCMLHLGDRPIRVTLHRALRALSLWQTMKLVWRLTSTDTISIEEVEECKQRDLLEKLMQEMAGEFPAFSDVFVKERDIFLCHSLQMAALPQMPNDGIGQLKPVKVVGVVGIGHANGIAKMWGRVDPHTIPSIMEIPPASLSTRICKYTLKYGLISLAIYGAFKLLRVRLGRFN